MVGLGVGEEEVVAAVERLFFWRDGGGGEVVGGEGVFYADFYGFVEGDPVFDTAVCVSLLCGFRQCLHYENQNSALRGLVRLDDKARERC